MITDRTATKRKQMLHWTTKTL